MNKPLNKQRGDASAVLIIVLVVALLGALGFVAWQNFGQKDEVVTTTDTSTAEEQVVEPSNTLALTEWGVEIPLDKAEFELTATYEDQYYYLTAPVEGCDVAQGNAGALTRYGKETDQITATDDNPELQPYDGKTYADFAADSENGQVVTVDGVVYGLSSPQGASCEDSGDTELANYNVVKNSLFPALRIAK